MAKDTVSPVQKSVPSSGGIKDGGYSTLTTPKKDTGGRYWSNGKENKEKILK